VPVPKYYGRLNRGLAIKAAVCSEKLRLHFLFTFRLVNLSQLQHYHTLISVLVLYPCIRKCEERLSIELIEMSELEGEGDWSALLTERCKKSR
jgi:hypothetical protein